MSEATARPTRTDRRRAETRARLLAAARELFAEKGVGATRTGEITERADVAAGSFYNHFADKDEVVGAVMAELTEEQGALVDARTSDLADPAAVVALAHIHFVRLAAEDPDFGRLLIQLDTSHRVMSRALGPRALRDVERGLESERFTFEPAAAAVLATGGALLGTMRGVVDGLLPEDADCAHAAAILRMLGLQPEDADETALAAARCSRWSPVGA